VVELIGFVIIIAGIFLDSKMNVEEPASVPEGAHA